jgi:hypothetical protein
MIKGLEYWYDRQQPRFLEQIVRGFSGFQYKTGWRELPDGTRQPPQLRQVPCTIANTDRLVATILRNNSENTLLTVPRITVFQTGLTFARDRLQHPNHVDTRHAVELAIDPDTGKYLPTKGKSYTIERIMPRPFNMTIQVDIWTENLDQKYQLAEQILTVIAPDFTIQNSDNALDWTARTTMQLEDITWSSRSIPIGTDDTIDIMSLTFVLPIYLSPPARVTEQRIIEQIIANIHDAHSTEEIVSGGQMDQIVVTPGNHWLRVEQGILTLLGEKAGLHDAEGNTFSWQSLIDLYGTYRPTQSKIRLKQNPDMDDHSDDVIGTFSFIDGEPNKLMFQIDPETLPANTLPPVDGVIKPLLTWPGNGLPPALVGQRYLILQDVAGPSEAWGNLQARENDIIEFRESGWVRAFESTNHAVRKEQHYVLNNSTGRQLRWTGYDWVLSVDGEYAPGMWRIDL